MTLAKFQAAGNTASLLLSKIEKDTTWTWAAGELSSGYASARAKLEEDVPAIFVKLATVEVLPAQVIQWRCGCPIVKIIFVCVGEFVVD